MCKNEHLISVGIDIGTSTTKMVVSRFLLKNTAGKTRIPSIEIINKEIIYESPIFRTPLKSSSEIDMEKIEEIILSQYEAANIVPEDVQTGAVIITGEAATKSNAEEALFYLSKQGGDFLVATAGPDLEAIVAAKGSGLYDASKQSSKVFANIDIGGGTANIAVYQYGKLLGTCTLHIGGKLIEFKNEVIIYISDRIKNSFSKLGMNVGIGDYISKTKLKIMTDHLAMVLARTLQQRLQADDYQYLLGHPPNWSERIDVITFSGGIAECIYKKEKQLENGVSFNDIGMVLAESLLENRSLAEFEWLIPKETSRATVIGACTQTTEISGATIQVDPSLLPIKNLPIHRIEFPNWTDEKSTFIVNAIREGIQIYDPFEEGQNFALFFTDVPLLSFQEIHKLVDAVIDGINYKKDPFQPLVIILKKDLAKAIGQTLAIKYPSLKCVCIDQINSEFGDYLDIGKLLQSGVVPVVMKSLAF